MFKSKRLNMVIALLLSIGMWCYVVYAVNPIQSDLVKGIPVQFENEQALNDRGLAIANTSEVAIDLSVEGSRQVVAGITPDDFVAVADVSECITGDNIVEVDIKCLKDVKRTSDATVTVHISVENIVSVEKNIKVTGPEVNEATSDAIEYELQGTATVTVTGAKSLCEEIEYVEAAVEEEISSEEEVLTVQLVPVNEREIEVANVNLSEETVTVKAVKYGFKEVGLKVPIEGENEDLEGVDSTETVRIKGKHSTIDEIDEIRTEPIDISKMKESQDVALSPILPEGVTLADNSSELIASVKLATKTESIVKIDSQDISCTGLEDGLSAVIASGTVKVKITGDENASADDIIITADVSEIEAGKEGEAKLSMTYSGNGKAELLTDSITVRIEE